MKRLILFFFISFMTGAVFAQIPDSLSIVQQVDSLIHVSRDFTAKNDFEKALEFNAHAEHLALETFGKESAAYGSCAFNKGRVNYFKGDFLEAENWYQLSQSIREKVLGKEHPQYANVLYSLATLYYYMGNYEKAEPLYLESKAVREKSLGKEHPTYASSLNSLAVLYKVMGNYEKAEPLYLESKAIWEKALGQLHPKYAQSLNNLANLYKDMGNYEKAEPLYLESKAIREKTLGKEHPDYAQTLNNLANLYKDMGNYGKAEPLYLESKAIREKSLGKEHPDYASSLTNLANLYKDMGNYGKAEPLYLESKAIREKTLGKEHPDYASILSNLADLNMNIGNYEKAEPLYLESKAIREKTLGKEHPDYAQTLNNLAILYNNLGNYGKAEPFNLESKAIREKALGKEHPDYAQTLNNLGNLYKDMGNYGKAEPFFFEANVIWEKALGKEHPDYAQSLNNLANLYTNKGNYEKAEPLYLESKAIWEKAGGKENPYYAISLNNLANLYKDMGKYEKAEPLYLESKAIREKVLGKMHPDYARSVFTLGNLYEDIENFEEAERFYLEANKIWENVLGKNNDDYVHSLGSLANLYEFQNRFFESEKLLIMYFELIQSRLSQSVTFLSSQELANYNSTFQAAGSLMLSYLHARTTGIENSVILSDLSYDQTLFQKGFLMQMAARLQALASSSPGATSINNDLKGYRRRIANQLSKPIAERQGLEELEDRANALEKELARNVAGYAEALRQVKWQEVQAALPDDAVSLEFVHFNVNFPKKTDSVEYAVLLVRPGADQPQFIPLFEERELDQLLNLDKERKVENINDLYALAKLVTGQLSNEKKSLYKLIWEKIEASGLEGITTVYFSPSGVLHRLNLGAIAIDEKTSLSDRYNLVALNSTRQLVVPASITPALQDAVVIGGVNYDRDTEIAAVETSTFQSTRSLASYWTESATRGESWKYLKWTEKEADRIAATLTEHSITVDAIKGKAASEEAFKGIGQGKPSPRIMHIATHGFFFPDPELKAASPFGDNEPVFKWSDNPMIRSGLVLAGANTAWRNETPTSPDMEDGILTAYEISQINLSNTELVVLSACETGLGDIQGNEGVYGLQRAFKIAGAKYLIMSLWQVPDRPTMEFMTTFYKNWLEGNLTIPDAFRKTQREMRDLYSNPYLWAGFVLVE